MRRFKITYLFLFCFSLSLSAQIKIVDQNSGEPVRFTFASDKQGRLIGITDNTGNITGDVMENEGIILRHFSYYPVTVLKQQIKNNRITLLPDTISLVEVSGEKNTSEYLRIRGDFECLQFQDCILAYEKKGIVEYLVPLKKGKIRKRIIKIEQRKDLFPATYGDVCDVPNLQRNLLINHSQLDKKESGEVEITESGKPIGTLFYQQPINTCYMELGGKMTQKDIRMLAVKTNLHHSVYAQTYSPNKRGDNGNYELENLTGIGFFHNIYQKIQKKEYQIMLFQNVRFTEVEYLSKQEAKRWKH